MKLTQHLLSEGEVDRLFIGKSCSKLCINLHNINNYQSSCFISLTNDCILEIAEYCKKSHLSITHFADQKFISTSRTFKDPLQEAKKKLRKNST